MSFPDPHELLPTPVIRQLDNGLVVAVLANPQAPVVATALWYRAGTCDETALYGGTAHFLEHMMFKGSARYGPGEIDRLTRALGGSNNAFTSHDATVYHFTFAADRWSTALAIEVDRMQGLELEPAEVDSERQVILEEVAMYEGEPWDALELAVLARFFAESGYGLPVLGTRENLLRIDGAVLRAFHQRYYQPSNAILVLAGDLDPETAHQAAADAFGALPPTPTLRAQPPASPLPQGLVRLERRQGELPRLLLALPAPAASALEHPILRLLLGVLASGRSSRLHRALVDEGQLCSWVSAEVGESCRPGIVLIAAELVPGIAPAEVEQVLWHELERLRTHPPQADEIARAKKIIYADWVFAHEKVEQQALLLGSALTHFDAVHPWRYLSRLFAATPAELAATAEQLQPTAGGVLGWSLPQTDDPSDDCGSSAAEVG